MTMAPITNNKIEVPINLDSFKEPENKPVEDSDGIDKDTLLQMVAAEIPAEDKDSNFGDYGEESEDEDDSDD